MHGKSSKRRAVVILHPDFDAPGKDGIIQAKEFAEKLVQSQRELVAAAQNQKPDIAAQIRAYVGNLQVIVRNLPEEVL